MYVDPEFLTTHHVEFFTVDQESVSVSEKLRTSRCSNLHHIASSTIMMLYKSWEGSSLCVCDVVSTVVEQKDQEPYITFQRKHHIMQILRRILPVCQRCSFHCCGQLGRAGQCTRRTAGKGLQTTLNWKEIKKNGLFDDISPVWVPHRVPTLALQVQNCSPECWRLRWFESDFD